MLDGDGVGHLGPHEHTVISARLVATAAGEPAHDGPPMRLELWNISAAPARYVLAPADAGDRDVRVTLSVPGGFVLIVREAAGAKVERRTGRPNVVTCTLTGRRALVVFTAEAAGTAQRARRGPPSSRN